MREWRAHLGQPLTLLALLGVSVILSLAAPFDSDALALAPRFGFWLLIAGATYGAGTLTSLLSYAWVTRHLPPVPGVLFTALATACVVTGVVLALDILIFADWPRDWADLWRSAWPIFAIGVVISVLLDAFRTALMPARAASVPAAPPLLARLPGGMRGRLVAISVEDHYVRVRTTKGEAMILMRLGDAIGETAPEPGLQVHRSHWVALWAVTRADKRDGRAILTMADGPDIPVSRSNMAAARDAGIV